MKKFIFIAIFALSVGTVVAQTDTTAERLGEFYIGPTSIDIKLYGFMNVHHPDRHFGERFLMNISREIATDSMWLTTQWKTLRIGTTAYDKNGRVLPQYVPLFVSKYEWTMVRNSRTL